MQSNTKIGGNRNKKTYLIIIKKTHHALSYQNKKFKRFGRSKQPESKLSQDLWACSRHVKIKVSIKVNMESGAECLLNVNLTPEGIEQKTATFPVITIVIRRQQNTRQGNLRP